MFSRVLVGFDGSPRGRGALALAAALTARDGEVIVCTVQHPRTAHSRVDPSAPRLDLGSAQRSVEQGQAFLREQQTLSHPLVIEAVDVAPALLDTASFHRADLLVLGACHRGRVGQAMLGSVAAAILHDPPCPVAVALGAGEEALTVPRIASIAVGCDAIEQPGPELDLAVRLAGELEPGPELDLAVRLAGELAAALHIVMIADTRVALAVEYGGAVAYPAVVKARRLAAEEGLAKVMAALPSGLSATGEVREGSPSEKLGEVSRGVDLLVLGAHHYGPVDRLMGRSVSAAVRRHAHCPLLVTPLGGEDDPRGRMAEI
jgi:nucleotide-binding universal stress UspA family protein